MSVQERFLRFVKRSRSFPIVNIKAKIRKENLSKNILNVKRERVREKERVCECVTESENVYVLQFVLLS